MARMRATATIPEDIIVEIVTRLPIKSVGRCRCVCKRWCSLFSGPKFAKSHMQSAFERRTLHRRLVVFTHEYESLDVDLREKKSSLREGQLNAPFKKPGQSLCILGSCNGLVACLRGDLSPKSRPSFTKGSLFIWNPSTRFYKEILGQDFFFQPGEGRSRGFGHVSGTDDYKVVLRGKRKQEVDIFSLRTRTWNSTKSQMSAPMQNKGLLLREALHWLGFNYEQDNAAPFSYFSLPIFVFALDLAKEEFRKMQVPSSSIMNFTYRSRMRLGVSCEGCLYIMHYTQLYEPKGIDYVTDFWVMREYGNSDSWTKYVTLRLSNEPDNPIFVLEPILLMETCAFVMNRPKRMFTPDEKKVPAATDMYMVHEHINKEKGSLYILHSNPPDMIVYEESLCEYEEGQKTLIIYVPQGLITLR